MIHQVVSSRHGIDNTVIEIIDNIASKFLMCNPISSPSIRDMSRINKSFSIAALLIFRIAGNENLKLKQTSAQSIQAID